MNETCPFVDFIIKLERYREDTISKTDSRNYFLISKIVVISLL